jgi:hypothetical protein
MKRSCCHFMQQLRIRAYLSCEDMASVMDKCQTNIKKDILLYFGDRRDETLDRKLKYK